MHHFGTLINEFDQHFLSCISVPYIVIYICHVQENKNSKSISVCTAWNQEPIVQKNFMRVLSAKSANVIINWQLYWPVLIPDLAEINMLSQPIVDSGKNTQYSNIPEM